LIRIGLTGSIGMGKTTTAALFAEHGIPVYSADDAVHRLYSGRAVSLIEEAFPGTTANGRVDRTKLAARTLEDPLALKRLEQIVHPLVREDEAAFLRSAEATGNQLALLDIPLLFETGGEARVDAVVVVTCDPAIQRERVMARDGMTAEKFEAILARQMPDAEKRKKADFLVDTGLGMDHARQAVARIVETLKARHGDQD
jgi:dephospho-CoA kinase